MKGTNDVRTAQDSARADAATGPRMSSRARRIPGGSPRPRSWGLVTLAALCVLGTGLGVAAWGLDAGQKETVLAVGDQVAVGQVITREDLVTASVSGVNGAIPVGEIGTVVNQTAVVDLVAGQILTRRMFAASAVPAAGQATVGLALDPARVPGAGLQAGDVVDVIAVPGGEGGQDDPAALDSPDVLAEGATVFDVEGVATAGGQLLVTLIVNASDAARVSAYSTQNRVAVVETAPAGSTGE